MFPGGALIGCSAGFVNVPRIKGTHTAMKSAMLAAEAAFEAIAHERSGDVLEAYPAALTRAGSPRSCDRPQRPAGGGALGRDLSERSTPGSICGWIAAASACRGRSSTRPTTRRFKRKEDAKPIDYPKPDGVLTFDRLSSVFVSNTNHEEDQPVHLTLKDADIPTAINLPVYAGPEQRYCPAGVYEFVEEANGEPRLQINAQNCVHCKTCDIKDPTQNINWVTPEGGGGPNYPNM